MCEFFSACITSDRVFWLPRSSSHEDIIDAHKLHVDGSRGPNAVRAELMPPLDAATVADLDTWRYRLDQDTRPDWYDEHDAAKRMRGAAELARQIDPVLWRVQTAASRQVDWTGEQRAEIVGTDRIVLPGVQLSVANLTGANLRGANLTRAYLNGANLTGADLYGADLYGADLYGADLIRANLTRANLPGANLNGANLRGAYYPIGNLPAGWVRDGAYLTRALAGRDVE